MAEDDDVDYELLELLRASLRGKDVNGSSDSDTRVLQDAEFIYNNSIDVAIDFLSTKQAAAYIRKSMHEQEYSLKSWGAHELHPSERTEATAAFIFTMDLLNFSFWSDDAKAEPFTVEYRGKEYTGYWSLVAALRRAIDEEVPITDPHYWIDENDFTEHTISHVFRSSNGSEMPMLKERLACLRNAGRVLYEKYDCSFLTCLELCKHSGTALVNLLARDFDVFRDEAVFEGKKVRFLKRAQILVADLWACFEGGGLGQFDDIDKITMFADYRVSQMLHHLGCLQYSPPLAARISSLSNLQSGTSWEIQLRGCSIWCIELLRREILKIDASAKVNAILIDFFLYDTVKKITAGGEGNACIPHHRTRCIWY